MQKINQAVLDGIAEGNLTQIMVATTYLENGMLLQSDMVRLWEAVVEGSLKGSREAARLGLKMSESSQEPEIRELYEDLIPLAYYSNHEKAFRQTISTGASIVRVQNGSIKSNGFEPAKYLELAKRCLLKIVREGNDYAKPFAVEALRNLEDQEGVKNELIAMAQRQNDPKLMTTVFESLTRIRKDEELEIARSDRQMILEAGEYDETTPGRLYVEMLFQSIETVLSDVGKKGRETGVTAAVMQLANAGITTETPGELLDELSIKLVQKNIENALFHALCYGTKRMKDEAADGLAAIGGERVTYTLKKIMERECDPKGLNEIGNAARTVLLKIHSKENPGLPPPLPPAAKQKEKRLRQLVR